MRTELWGLRDKATHKPIYTYWASSNKYRALFAKRETAEDACRNPKNPNMEPFCITGDPIHAAGGCYCRECKYHLYDAEYRLHSCSQPMGCMGSVRVRADDFCSYGELREGDAGNE